MLGMAPRDHGYGLMARTWLFKGEVASAMGRGWCSRMVLGVGVMYFWL